MKKEMFCIISAMLVLAIIGFAVAENQNSVDSQIVSNVNNSQASTNPNVNVTSNVAVDSGAGENASPDFSAVKETSNTQLRNRAEQAIAEVKARIAVYREGNSTSALSLGMAEQLLQQADKFFANGNYGSAITSAHTALARFESVENKAVANVREKEQLMQERQSNLEEWNEKLNKTLVRVDDRIAEIKDFSTFIEQKQGCLNVDGENITIKKIDGVKSIISENISAPVRLNLTGRDIGGNATVLAALLLNGKLSPVKIMPDTASLNALEKLKARCGAKCSIELKETGILNNVRAVYTLTTEKDSRIFLIFPKKMTLSAEVNPETGDVLSISKPWWAFMAKEINANETEIKSDIAQY